MNSRSLRRSRLRMRGARILILMLAVVVVAIVASCAAKAPAERGPSAKAVALRDAMDKLWNDHVTFTRLFIVDAAAGLPETQATTERLLRNQDDIGNAVASYYGPDAGAKLTALLHTHITTAGELVMASKANDTAKANDAQTRWSANADSIATFLSGANPSNWPEAEMKQMMHDHLTLTAEEATAQLHSDWSGSIAAYDKVHTQILSMADMLTDGIVKQYPDKF